MAKADTPHPQVCEALGSLAAVIESVIVVNVLRLATQLTT